MSQLVGIVNKAHSLFCYLPPKNRDAVRKRYKPYRSEVLVDDAKTQIAITNRITIVRSVLRDKVTELKPDVLVNFGNDQEKEKLFSAEPGHSPLINPTAEPSQSRHN